jgi:hypothetical protein
MLERGGSSGVEREQVFETLWKCLNCQVQLPEAPEKYFGKSGLVSQAFQDRRRFPRFHYCHRAILINDATFYAVYTKDISRGGISFYHAKQMLPCSTGELICGNGASLHVTVRRCRRVADQCYLCGVQIVGTDANLLKSLLPRVMAATGAPAAVCDESEPGQADPAIPPPSPALAADAAGPLEI